MQSYATARGGVIAALVVGVSGWGVLIGACGTKARIDPGPDLQILGESTRIRMEDPLPRATPWFDGSRVTLVAARGETLGIQVVHRPGGSITLAIANARVQGFAVETLVARRASTTMYGPTHGAGSYPDALDPIAGAITTTPAYFEIASDTPGTHVGELVVAGRHIPVTLEVTPLTMPALGLRAWAYEDPRELAWAAGVSVDAKRTPANPLEPTAAERSCIALFRAHGVLLSPDLSLDSWPARQPLVQGMRDVPVMVGDDPTTIGEGVTGWITATRGTGQVPFAIPIDEPRTPEARAKVRALADLVRAAGGGPETFRFAVTDTPNPVYGDAVDLYISAKAAHLLGDRHARWTYNGGPPQAGGLTLDAETPGTRTWGWIGWRWKIPVWYVWDALYWHDRHNRKGAPLPGRTLDATRDATSFDDGEDHGNLDGVLALPGANGCRGTLRLAALRRGLQDRALLELAAACQPEATAKLAAELVPKALGDAPASGGPSWSTDEATWELARRRLLTLAACP